MGLPVTSLQELIMLNQHVFGYLIAGSSGTGLFWIAHNFCKQKSKLIYISGAVIKKESKIQFLCVLYFLLTNFSNWKPSQSICHNLICKCQVLKNQSLVWLKSLIWLKTTARRNLPTMAARWGYNDYNKDNQRIMVDVYDIPEFTIVSNCCYPNCCRVALFSRFGTFKVFFLALFSVLSTF